jgi:hypothetical protein
MKGVGGNSRSKTRPQKSMQYDLGTVVFYFFSILVFLYLSCWAILGNKMIIEKFWKFQTWVDCFYIPGSEKGNNLKKKYTSINGYFAGIISIIFAIILSLNLISMLTGLNIGPFKEILKFFQNSSTQN